MLRIGICDDDPHMLAYLSALSLRILPEATISEYNSGLALLSGNKDSE